MRWLRNLMASKRGYFYTEGGIHMEKHKEQSHKAPLEDMPIPNEVVIYLRQHVGAMLEPTVKPKDSVKVGQIIGDSKAFVSAPVHATISGTVKKIEPRLCPTGETLPAIVIKGDGKDEWEKLTPMNPLKANKKDIIDRIRAAGIVGLGGAGFPTFIKLQPPTAVDSLIINAAECEPYLAKDYHLMKEFTDDVMLGADIVARTIEVENRYFAIHADKMDIVPKLKEIAAKYDFKVVVLPVKYPHGAEKVLIDAVIGKRVPPFKLPFDVGAMVFNVETCLAITKAVRDGKPLVEKYLTVAGEGIWHTKNLKVRVGTNVQDIVDYCGGLTQECRRIIFGGPMTGFAMVNLNTNVVRLTAGFIGLTDSQPEFGPCIRCGRCVTVCDNGMNPSLISTYIEKGLYDPDLNTTACVECGACSYICPEHRPITHFIRVAKKMHMEWEAKQKK
ncbi:MAG: electron transport complex subunit RsxC [Planctomycetes bacterium]|nr:electron transport complex subunit RsxC [Planctomycetota bacterium]